VKGEKSPIVSGRLAFPDVAPKVDSSYLRPRPDCFDNWQPLVHLDGTGTLQCAFCSALSVILCLNRKPASRQIVRRDSDPLAKVKGIATKPLAGLVYCLIQAQYPHMLSGGE
jgi:hypothetical protein